MKFLIITLLFAGFAMNVGAQDISNATMQWNSTSTFDVNLGSSTDENTALVLTGRSTITWKNDDGSVRKTFSVSEFVGEWSSLNNGESLRLEISNSTDIGSVTITKNSNGNKAVISISSSSNESSVYELLLQ
jgi:hypothetical protein